MTSADQRGWGHPGAPGSAQERSYRQQHIVVIEVGGVRLAIRREVSRLFKGFIDDLLATGYRLDVNEDDWGFANRDIRGRPGVKSNHAWGLAIDLNAIDNPMTEAHPGHAGHAGHDHRGVHTDMPPETARLAAKWGLTWGANYRGSRKDAMHLEFEGTPADVGRYPHPANRPAPPPPTEEDLMPVLPMLTVPTICVTEGGGWVLYRPQSGVVEVLDDELLTHYRNLGYPTWERVPGEPHRVPQHLFASWVDAARLKD